MSLIQPVSVSGTSQNERSPFARLADLLEGHEPGKSLISLSLGEPQHPIHGFVGSVLGRYP